MIGLQHSRVDGALRETDRKVRERRAALREANRRLEELMRSKNHLLANVGHEVRNPLAVVLGFAEELQQGQDTIAEDERSELIGLIADQSREISNIIDDLLVAARAEVGSLIVVPEETDVAEQVRAVVRSCAPEAREAIGLDLEPAPAWADPARARQIVRNLVSNALRCGGKQIGILVRRREGHASSCVCDDGPGIPEEHRIAIFEPHRQGGQPASGSLGIGLHVSRTLARAMGGDLVYRYEGGSSVFEVLLPAALGVEDAPPLEVGG